MQLRSASFSQAPVQRSPLQTRASQLLINATQCICLARSTSNCVGSQIQTSFTGDLEEPLSPWIFSLRESTVPDWGLTEMW